jgi:hypothetical protein
MRTLHLLVEGEGDMQAAPVLLRRLLHEEHGRYDWLVDRKHVMKVWGLAKLRSKLADFMEHLRGKSCDGALILLDLEDQLPCEEGPALAAEIAALQPLPFPVAVVFAYKEYEAWFLAGISSIATQSPHFANELTYPNTGPAGAVFSALGASLGRSAECSRCWQRGGDGFATKAVSSDTRFNLIGILSKPRRVAFLMRESTAPSGLSRSYYL